MDPDASPVKTHRRYDSSGRQDRARLVRAHVLNVAEKLFLRRGYASTTVAAIAATAGVSVETIYKKFGGKPGLIRSIQQAGTRWYRSDAGPRPRRRDVRTRPRTSCHTSALGHTPDRGHAPGGADHSAGSIGGGHGSRHGGAAGRH